MPSKLKAIEPKKAKQTKPKVLIFGKPGAGKTWASMDFPKVYYIDTEGGATRKHYTDKLQKSGGVYLGMDQGALDFAEIIDQIKALATEKHEYKTLVIDSISKVFNQAIAEEADRLGDKDAFGASKKPAIAYMRQLVSWLMRLDMNVILIAHEKAEWGIDDKGQRVEIGATFDCWDKLEYELDLALNIFRQGNSHKAKVRKSRLVEFPDASVFPWSYVEFASRYGQDVMEQQAAALELATPEQLDQLSALLKVVRVPDDWEAKCLKKANVESFAEMDAVKVQSLINLLKEKANPTKGDV